MKGRKDQKRPSAVMFEGLSGIGYSGIGRNNERGCQKQKHGKPDQKREVGQRPMAAA